MSASAIRIGVVVSDWYGRFGIVCERRSKPSEDWIGEQINSKDIEKLGETGWWGVMPLDGGFSWAPGPHLTYVREATYEDFLQAADFANSAGRETLLKVFPDYVNRLLEERGRTAKN
jgi:hypothetical protein